jgi:integrase
MPTWDKRTKSYVGRVRITGHPQKTQAGFPTKDAARLWELNVKHALKNSLPVPSPEIRLTFASASDEYLAWCQTHGYVDGTIITKSQIVRDFLSFLASDPILDDVDTDIIEFYLASKPKSKTANRHLRELTTLFNWFVKNRMCDHNPCVGVEKYRTTKYYPYVPPPEDINKVLLQADEFQFDFLQTIYHLSARRKEVMELKWDDVDFVNRTVSLWTRKRFGGQLERDVLKMNGVLYEILMERYESKSCEWVFHIDGNQLTRTKIEKMLNRLCKKAGVRKFGFHAIRHHVSALMAASKKLSLVDIQRQLRHKSATTTNHYLTGLVAESNAAEVIEEMQTQNQESNIVPLRRKK